MSFLTTKQQEKLIESTIGVDCHTLNLSEGEVTVWDFAGQQEYTVTHQFFLSIEVCFVSFLCLDKKINMLVCFYQITILLISAPSRW